MSGPKLLLAFSLPGRCMVKKNSSRRVGRGKSTRVIYTARYRTWEAEALREIMRAAPAVVIDFPVEARFRFYFANRMAEADVSNLVEGPQDALVKGHVLADDRWVYRAVVEKFFGQAPRTEVELWTYRPEAA